MLSKCFHEGWSEYKIIPLFDYSGDIVPPTPLLLQNATSLLPQEPFTGACRSVSLRLQPTSLRLPPPPFSHTSSPLSAKATASLPQCSPPRLYLRCPLFPNCFLHPTVLCTYSNPASSSPLPQHLAWVCTFPECPQPTKLCLWIPWLP